jgi:hypothetical protein
MVLEELAEHAVAFVELHFSVTGSPRLMVVVCAGEAIVAVGSAGGGATP